MEILISAFIFLVGVVLVIKGGDWFVDAASWMAKALGIPPFIVGATIVSVATTMPEMIVSMTAAAQGKTDMAIGNAVGSVIANTGLILAIAMIFMSITIRRKAYLMQCAILVGAATVLLVASMSGSLSIWGSIALLVLFGLFMYRNVQNAKEIMEETKRPDISRKNLAKNVGLFMLGAASIVVGSQFLVNSGSDIAAFFGVPERIIAVTLVAVGTSLPELVTTVTAIVKKQSGLSIGNLIGANTIDISLILPLCSLVSGQQIPVSQQSIMLDLPVCLGITLIAFVPLLIREKASKLHGLILLGSYAAYLIVVL